MEVEDVQIDFTEAGDDNLLFQVYELLLKDVGDVQKSASPALKTGYNEYARQELQSL